MRKTTICRLALFLVLFVCGAQKASGQYTLADTALVLQYIKQVDSYLYKEKLDSALMVSGLALEICKSIYTEDNLLTAKSLTALGKAWGVKRNTREALVLLDQAYTICLRQYPEDPLVGQILMTKGMTFGRGREFHESLRYFEKAKDFMVPRLGEKNSKMLTVFGNLATGYYSIKNHPKAIYYNLKALDVLEANPGTSRMHAGILYTNTGVVYRNMGDYANALKYALKGLAIYEKMNSAREMADAYNSIGMTHAAFGNTKMGLEYLEKAKDLIGATNPELIHNNVIGHLYTVQKKYDEAIKILQQQIELYQLKPGALPLNNVADAYYYLGRVYYEKGDFLTAENHFLKALDIMSASDDIYNNNKYVYLDLCGLTAVRQKDFVKANRFFDQAALYFDLPKNGDNNTSSPYANLLANKGLMYQHWYRETRNIDYLYQATACFREFDQAVDKYYHRIEFAPVLRTLSENFQPAYTTSIETDLMLAAITDSVAYQHTAFLYAEKTKFMQLRKGSQESAALHFGGIPPQKLERENDLRTDIAYFEKQRFSLGQKGVNPLDSVYVKLNNTITDLSQQYELLKKDFELHYPDYYRLKYEQQVTNVPAIQRDLLQPNEAVVSYTVSDSNIFIFVVRKDDFKAVQVKKDVNLEPLVLQMRSGMTDYFVNPAMANQYSRLSADYTSAASILYEKLVAPIAAMLPEKVVIIPDGILGYVPFEALLAEKPADPTRWHQHHYFQNDHTISYCYSATMLREMRNRKHLQEPEIPFLGFAPKYDGDTTILASSFQFADNMRKDLQPLPNSGEEVYRAAKIMNGQSFVGSDATEDQFASLVSKGRIIHLATHGQANDKNGDFCFLVFSEQKDSVENEILYAREIYNLQINADLVTLSACETGIGEIQNGEGVISLARAFSYAGAKSIVTSLWSVSDGKTKDLMLDFYKNIHGGMSKDMALRDAKRAFLKNHKGLSAHPFYWAGFIGIGL